MLIARLPVPAWRVRLRSNEWRLMMLAVLVLAFATADVMTGGPLTSLDGEIRTAIQPQPSPLPWWLASVAALGDLGVGMPLVAIAALICAQALWRLWPVVTAIGILGAAEGAVLLLKTVVARPGPGPWAHRVGYPGYFPSGHTATASVVAATVVDLILVWRYGGRPPDGAERISLLCGWAAGTLAAIAAVLGDFHWTSDGIGGLALATVVLVIGFAAARSYCGAEAPVQPVQR